MDFNLPADDDPRRLEVREWLEARPNVTYDELAEKGYAVPHWPAPWGLSADPETQLIIEQEINNMANPAIAGTKFKFFQMTGVSKHG